MAKNWWEEEDGEEEEGGGLSYLKKLRQQSSGNGGVGDYLNQKNAEVKTTGRTKLSDGTTYRSDNIAGQYDAQQNKEIADMVRGMGEFLSERKAVENPAPTRKRETRPDANAPYRMSPEIEAEYQIRNSNPNKLTPYLVYMQAQQAALEPRVETPQTPARPQAPNQRLTPDVEAEYQRRARGENPSNTLNPYAQYMTTYNAQRQNEAQKARENAPSGWSYALDTAKGSAQAFESTLKQAMGNLDKAEYWILHNLGIGTFGGYDINSKEAYEAAHAVDTDIQKAVTEAKEGKGKWASHIIDAFAAAGNIVGSTALSYGLTGMGALNTAKPYISQMAKSTPELGASLTSRVANAGMRLAGNVADDILSSPTNLFISAQSGISTYDTARGYGADHRTATAAGLAAAFAEYFSNKMFSGTPLEDNPEEKGYVVDLIDDIATRLGKQGGFGTKMESALKTFFNNKAVSFIFDKSGEGMEEVITGIIDPLIARLTYNKDEDLATFSSLLDEFIGGVLMSVVMSAPGALRGATNAAIDATRPSYNGPTYGPGWQFGEYNSIYAQLSQNPDFAAKSLGDPSVLDQDFESDSLDRYRNMMNRRTDIEQFLTGEDPTSIPTEAFTNNMEASNYFYIWQTQGARAADAYYENNVLAAATKRQNQAQQEYVEMLALRQEDEERTVAAAQRVADTERAAIETPATENNAVNIPTTEESSQQDVQNQQKATQKPSVPPLPRQVAQEQQERATTPPIPQSAQNAPQSATEGLTAATANDTVTENRTEERNGQTQNAASSEFFNKARDAAAQSAGRESILDRIERSSGLGEILSNLRAGRQQRADQQLQQRNQEQKRRADQFRNQARTRHLTFTSAAEQGIANGTDQKSFAILPEDMRDNEMRRVIQAYAKRGVNVVPIIGQIKTVDKNGKPHTVRGLFTGDGKTIYVQADNYKLTWKQLLEHEEMHRLIRQNPQYKEELKKALLADKRLRPYLSDIIDQYAREYHRMGQDNAEIILEEMLADYRAGFDTFDVRDRNAGNLKVKSIVQKDIRKTERKYTTNGGRPAPASITDTFASGQNSVEPPYRIGTKALAEFEESLSPKARETYDLFKKLTEISRAGTAVITVGSGKKAHLKRDTIADKSFFAKDWNKYVKNNAEFADTARKLIAALPKEVKNFGNFNDDGTITPTEWEKEFKMNRSFVQRVVDALPKDTVQPYMTIDGHEYRITDKPIYGAVGGEEYRQAILAEKRRLYKEGRLPTVSVGSLSHDNWGAMGFLATNTKTGASGDFTTFCPQMYFNKGCFYCYRRAALTTGSNNKLTGEKVWYSGEILQLRPEDVKALNKKGGLRIQSFGDWQDMYTPMLADMLYDAQIARLQIKVITKEPSMIDTVARLREQALGLSLYFNLSADYTLERRGPGNNFDTKGPTSSNPKRPFLTHDWRISREGKTLSADEAETDIAWKRAMSVQEANEYRKKYDWVNTRIVATTLKEYIRGLIDPMVDVVTGYHGKIKYEERVSSETGETLIEVEALGDSGMPQFTKNEKTGEWEIARGEDGKLLNGKNHFQKALCQAIIDRGLQDAYYAKACCITGRCADCQGLCGGTSNQLSTKNATNRDADNLRWVYAQKEANPGVGMENSQLFAMNLDEDVEQAEDLVDIYDREHGITPIKEKDVETALKERDKFLNKKAKEAARKAAKAAGATQAQVDANERYSEEVNALTYFSGGGLVDYALRRVIGTSMAVEFDPGPAAIYALNNGEVYIGDVRDFSNEELDHLRGVEYFHASPVCKRYSAINTTGRSKADSTVDLETAEATAKAIRKLRPKVFTLEQVAAYNNSKALQIILDALNECGYDVKKDVLNAYDYGAATSRHRLMLRAVRDGEVPPLPAKVKGYSWFEATADKITSLKTVEYLNPSTIERINNTPKLVEALKNQTEPILILGGTPGRTMRWAPASDPCPSIQTRMSDARILMPDGTIYKPDARFWARIMGLPEGYQFTQYRGHDNQTQGMKVVGNGVPVQLTQKIFGNLLNEVLDTGVRYSEEIGDGLAPTFYSKMEREIESYKGNKIGASSVESYLRGHGVKEEEIKWSGIQQFLDGKRSVTKEELLDFVRANQVEPQTITLDRNNLNLHYTDEEREKKDNLTQEKLDLLEEARRAWLQDFGDELPILTYASAFSNDKPGAVIRKATNDMNTPVGDKLWSITRKLDRTQAELRELDATVTRRSEPKYEDYSLYGGYNYREYLYTMPNSDYSNTAMRMHWGKKGVLAHARVQDFSSDGWPVIFVDEIQSDWHNAGHKYGYTTELAGREAKRARIKELEAAINERYDDFFNIVDKYVGTTINGEALDSSDVEYGLLGFGFGEKHHEELLKVLTPKEREFILDYKKDSDELWELDEWDDRTSNEVGEMAPPAPYAKTYHEFVLKNLIRQAAEDGYDYLAWTTGEMQEERWSDDYAEGYRIEYDQDIPKFLNKYGKQWDTQVTQITLDQNGETVPAILINDEMKNSVLYEGQARYSEELDAMDSDYLAAVESGDMDTAQRIIDQLAAQYVQEFLLPSDANEEGFKYHRGKAPTKTFTRYAVFNVSKDGFRYAYAGNANPTPLGAWLDAQNLKAYMSDLTQFDDGSFATYIPGDTGAPTNAKFSPERQAELGLRGGQRWLMERGGKHSSDVPNFSQMNLHVDQDGNKVTNALKDGVLPHNKLVFEVEYGVTEGGDLTEYVKTNGRMMKGKNQGLAKIEPNQYYDFKTNANAIGNWGIGGTFKITRLVPYDEIVRETENYKAAAIAEAKELYEKKEITKADMKKRIENANKIQAQGWLGGYKPEDFGLTVESVAKMVADGAKAKLTDAVTYDDDGNIILPSRRFDVSKKDFRYSEEFDPEELARTTPEALARWQEGDTRQKVSKVRTNTYAVSGLFNALEEQMDEANPENYKYDVVKEKTSIREARRRLENGIESEREKLSNKSGWDGVDLDTAMGILHGYRTKGRLTGDYTDFWNWTKVIREKGTMGGHLVQSFAKYTRTGTGTAQKAAEDLQEQYKLNPAQEQKVRKIRDNLHNILDEEDVAEEGLKRAKGEKKSTRQKKPKPSEVQRRKDAENLIKRIANMYDAISKDHGIPVDKWLDMTGEELAKRIAQRFGEPTAKTRTTMQIILGDLLKFAEEHSLPERAKAESRSAIDTITDYLSNRNAYGKAWVDAQSILRAQYADDQEKLDALEAFLNSTISYNGEGTDRTMLDAILQSANVLGISESRIRDLAATGVSEGTIRRIGDELADQVRERMGADYDESFTQELRDAVRRHITGIVLNDPALADRLSRLENAAAKELDIKLAKLLTDSRGNKSKAAASIADYLIKDLKIPSTDAAIATQTIVDGFFEELAERSRARLDRMFAPKVEKERKQTDKLVDLIRLGGFTYEAIEDAVADAYGIGELSRSEQKRILADMARFGEIIDAMAEDDLDGLKQLIREQAAVRNTKLSRLSEKTLAGETDAEYLREFAQTQLESIAGDFAPRSRGAKVSTYQTISHLLNMRTTLRNFIANQVFDFVDSGANNVAALTDMALSAITKQRTVGINKSWASQQKRAGAKQGLRRNALEVNLDVSPSERQQSKYGTAGRRTWSMASSNAAGRIMSRLEAVMGYELNTTDEMHKGSVFGETIDSLASFVEQGTMTQEEANEAATEMALYRSFQDDTLVGTMLKGLKDVANLVGTGTTNGKTIGRLKVKDFGLGDLLIKYTQVPGALIHRTLEFSPIGLAKAVYDLALAHDSLVQTSRRGENTTKAQRNFALSFGRAITGTGIMTLFYMLAKAGLLRRGDDDEDKNAAAMHQAQGFSGTQLNLSALSRWIDGEDPAPQEGDILSNINYLEPLDGLMAVATMLANEDKKLTPKNLLLASLNGAYRSVSDLSVIQTIGNIIDTIKYHDKENGLPLVMEIAYEIASGSLSGFVPSPVRQLAQATDTIYRDQYTSLGINDQIRDRFKNSVPGLRQTLAPKLTPFGENKKYQKPFLNAINATLNPGDITVYDADRVVDELNRLYSKTGETKIWPDRNAPYSIKQDEDKYTLTPDERSKYQRTRGQLTKQIMEGVLDSSWYATMETSDQVEAMNWAGLFANYVAKKEFFNNREMEYKADTYEKYYTDYKAGTPLADVVASRYSKAVNVAEENAQAEAIIEEAAPVVQETAREMSGEAKRFYASFIRNGVSTETAQNLAETLEGNETTGHEQWRLIYDNTPAKEQEKAVTAVMTEDMLRNWNIAKSFGVDMNDYIAVREGFIELNGRKSQTQAEWNATLDNYTFSKNESEDLRIKGAMWQILTGSESTKNNPYNKESGQKVLDSKSGGKGSGSYAPARIPTLRVPEAPRVTKPQMQRPYLTKR